MCCSPACCDCLLVILAIIFPPLPVWIKRGFCSADSLINILLCVLGLLPGLVHAWYIIARYPLVVAPDDVEHQRHHYYIHVPQERQPQPQHQHQYQPPQQPTYGSINNSDAGNEQPPNYNDVVNKPR